MTGTSSEAYGYHVLLYAIFGESYNHDDPPQIVNPKKLIEQVEAIFMTLSDGEVSVTKSRFGLIDGELKSRAELAALFGKTIQEIQTLELEIMKKLRHPSRSGVLREFLD